MSWNKNMQIFLLSGWVLAVGWAFGATWGSPKVLEAPVASPTVSIPSPVVQAIPKKDFMDIEVTAYTEAEDECGKPIGHPAYGITASGEKVRRGIIAVDTSVIPMHSKVLITGLGKWSGEYEAKDTGGAIVGNRVDIYVPTKKEAFELGRRKAKLYILGNK